MIPNNNFSVLPWYGSLDQQNARKWWLFGKVYPLYCRGGYILPFQLIIPHTSNTYAFVNAYLFDANTNTQLANITQGLRDSGLTKKDFPALDYDVIVYPGTLSIGEDFDNGRYYIRADAADGQVYYSEVFTVINQSAPYLKIRWWDEEDFTMDAGTIVYTNPIFENVLYLQADLAKPEYPFEEEGDTRDGYFFPVKQISEKRYKFSFLASEYLLDVMRFIRLSDHVVVEYRGQQYSVDNFLITPEWQAEGDVAVVQAEFDTATVAKKLGLGYIKALRGDFNDDFNNDFDNR